MIRSAVQPSALHLRRFYTRGVHSQPSAGDNSASTGRRGVSWIADADHEPGAERESKDCDGEHQGQGGGAADGRRVVDGTADGLHARRGPSKGVAAAPPRVSEPARVRDASGADQRLAGGRQLAYATFVRAAN